MQPVVNARKAVSGTWRERAGMGLTEKEEDGPVLKVGGPRSAKSPQEGHCRRREQEVEPAVLEKTVGIQREWGGMNTKQMESGG